MIRFLRICLILVIIPIACTGPSTTEPDLNSNPPEDILAGDLTDSDALDASTEEDAAGKDIDKLIENGKYWLAVSEPFFAYESFVEALELEPDSSSAAFGAGLSRLTHTAELVGMILNLPGQFLGHYSGEDRRSENDQIAMSISELFFEMCTRFNEADDYFSLITDPEFSWEIDRASIYYQARPIIVYRGKFDLGDVYMFRAISTMMALGTSALSAQDWHTDYAYLITQVKDLSNVTVLDLITIVERLFGTDPRFFALNQLGGDELFLSCKSHFHDIGMYIVDAFEHLESETPAANDVSRMDWEGEAPSIHISNMVKYQGEEGEETVLAIEIASTVRTLTEDLVISMENSGNPIPFSTSLALQLSTVLGIANKLGLTGILENFVPLDISSLEIGDILFLLSTLMVDSIAFDWTVAMETPFGINIFFPGLTDDEHPVFLMEWECPEDLNEHGFPSAAKGLLCSKDAALVDSSHFVGTEWELPADGQLTRLPYFVPTDPNWNGLLLVDENYWNEDAASWVVPDEYLNQMGLHAWLENILGLF